MGNGVVEAVEVTDLVTDLQRLAARLDPDQIADSEVAGVLADLGQAKRLVDGMLTLMVRRSVEVAGESRLARDQVAAATGTTPGAAKRLLDTSIRLREEPEVAAAVRDGRLSAVQAEAVADAATADPGRTAELLQAAASQTVADLKRTCRDVRAAADPDPAATRQRHHRQRTFRTWHEPDGEWKAFLSGPADMGARIEAAIRPAHDRVFKTAHAEGRREEDAAYRFDALLATLEDAHRELPGGHAAAEDADGESGGASTLRRQTAGRSTARRGRQAKVIIRVDAAALKRGRTTAAETCEIAGVGRVPVEAVREQIPDAHLAYVIADAVDVSVAHLGRQVTARQRTAMEARGYECEVPGCRATHLLEIDHVFDWAISRQTELALLAWLCRRHHRQKTAGTHRLTGPPGNRRWSRADQTHHQQRPIDDLVAGRARTPSSDNFDQSARVNQTAHIDQAADDDHVEPVNDLSWPTASRHIGVCRHRARPRRTPRRTLAITRAGWTGDRS